ncbi:MAG TPA: thioredoxin domain-containing protein [Chitinophagaceae bacterium]|nr:thioredoxin domain-containing protein [Chitinophagaceae bacterium]
MSHTHTNRLIHESSPYLLQHAHNPVDWYPWGDEALQRAKAEDKPILVSIGYAACHWCHVMERESFEDEGTARLMNEHFVNIKIDREERPDLDHIYMDAVQAITGSGGWPLNVFLLPDGKPFYGGTYYPPVRAFNRASWKEILMGVSQAYQERRTELDAQAENLTQHLVQSNAFGISQQNGDNVFTEENLQQIYKNIMQQGDRKHGGFGRAPKFPQTFSIQFLLRHYHYTKNEDALQQAMLSLDKMIYGGIYDQLGGGFARYSTDEEWLAPHFEKMLYDNALLVSALSEAYQLTGAERYRRVIEETLSFIEREMLSDEGGFYSALDADSEGEEGKYYVWSIEEVREVLGEDADLFCAYYNVTENGNWHEQGHHGPPRNILRVLEPPESFVKTQGLEPEQFGLKLAQWKRQLLARRSGRIRPLLDDKILLNWNALMNSAYCKAYAATGIEHYREMAVRNMEFLLKVFQNGNGGWHHSYKNGQAKMPAFLDDLADLVQALIHVQEITGEGERLVMARELAGYIIEKFGEEETSFFYYTNREQYDVIIRKKEVYDGATPSGNAVMGHNLLYLSVVFDMPHWKDRSAQMVSSLGQVIIKYPTSFGVWASLLQAHTRGTPEIVVTAQKIVDWRKQILAIFIPHRIFQSTERPDDRFPLLRDKPVAAQPFVFLCKNYVCHRPENSLQGFFRLLETV